MSGLDATAVSAHLKTRATSVQPLLDNLTDHFTTHGGYVAFSGGRDSTVVVDLARRAYPGIPVVWFDSGLEFPDNRVYITALGDKWDLNLHLIKSEPDALTVLASSGSWDHNAPLNLNPADLHDVLITTPARKAHELFGVGEVTGMRAEESVGRRALLAPGQGHYSRKDGSQVFAPIWSWNSRDVRTYLAHQGIPENPVYAKLAAVGAPERAQRVGLVVDGNNPDFGRFTYLRLAYPELWATLCETLPRLREWR